MILNIENIINIFSANQYNILHNSLMIQKIYKFHPAIDYYIVKVYFDLSEKVADKLVEIIPQDIFENIKNKKVVLAIVNSEATHSIVEELYKNIVIKLNIPEEQILFLSNSFNIKSAVESTSKKYNKKNIKTSIISVWEYRSAQVETFNLTPAIDKTKIIPNKKFLCLNRRWALHRPALVSMLLAKNLLQYGHVSLGDGEDHGWDKNYNKIYEAIDNEEFRQIFLNNKQKIFELPYLYLDIECLEYKPENDILRGKNDHIFPGKKLIPYFNDSYFSVISETYFFEKTIFLTEKTFNAMTQRHPFVLSSTPFSLEMLKDMGYKTFYPYINEDYDKETDHGKRLMMVVKEVERLCNLTHTELNNLILGVRDICEHNYQHLVSRVNVPGRYSKNVI